MSLRKFCLILSLALSCSLSAFALGSFWREKNFDDYGFGLVGPVISREGNKVILEFFLPGFNKNEVEILVEDATVLVIKATHKDRQSKTNKAVRKERHSKAEKSARNGYHEARHYKATFTIPWAYESIRAKMQDGILTVTLTVKNPLPAKKVEVE